MRCLFGVEGVEALVGTLFLTGVEGLETGAESEFVLSTSSRSNLF